MKITANQIPKITEQGRIPEGYIPGVERTHPYKKIGHLYKGTFEDPGLPMCKRGWNRGDSYSIWRNPSMDYSICKVCLRRALQGKEGVPL